MSKTAAPPAKSRQEGVVHADPGFVRQVIERLERDYGVPEWSPRFDPVEELVCCILTQHTTDAVAFPAFDRLRAKYPGWQAIVDAGPERIAEDIKSVGLAGQKAKSIVSSLRAIKERTGDYTLEPLRKLPPLEARKWLMSLPGVGPKTASIVLSFAMGRDVIPVDTHVYRVSWRLGIIPEKTGESKAHDLLLQAVPKDLAFRYHVALIQHGRSVCKALRPRCAECSVRNLCRWYRSQPPRTEESRRFSRNRSQ